MWTVAIRKDVHAESTCCFEWPVAMFTADRVVSLVGVIDTNRTDGLLLNGKELGIPRETITGTDREYDGPDTSDARRYGVRRLSSSAFEKATKKLGRTVPCSLSGDLTHSAERPIWTVRQRGMGGLVRYPAGGHERLEAQQLEMV